MFKRLGMTCKAYDLIENGDYVTRALVEHYFNGLGAIIRGRYHGSIQAISENERLLNGGILYSFYDRFEDVYDIVYK